MRLRWRSLRVRAPMVVLAAVVAMPALAWLSHLSDATVGRRMLRRVERTAQEAGALADGPDADARLDALATRRGLWLRVLDAEGHTRVDRDHDPPQGLARVSSELFFGPGGAPTLADADAGRPPLEQRELAWQAREGGQASACEALAGGALLVCTAALELPDGQLVWVQESSRRAIRSLYDLRYQLVKLSLDVAAVGLFLGLWLGWRMVRPIERLRAQVLDRTAARSTRPVELPRDDELGDLAQAFNQLLSALEQRDRANEAFAADLVHELKNPLAAVRAAAEALERGDVAPQRAARLAVILGDAARRLDGLASQFLDLARAEAGLYGSLREPVDLAALCAALVDAAGARHEGVAFRFTADKALSTVVGVPERLEAALRNLLDNAAAFALEGTGPPRVEVHLAAADGGLSVEVRDSGPGIAAADLPRVFERYFSRRHGGTGLGLPLARAVAEAHGGRLEALPGLAGAAGARLRLWLPG